MGYDVYVRGAQEGDEPTYFRRSIWISNFLNALVELNMGFWSPAPIWPTPPEPQDEHLSFDVDDEYVALTDEGREYLRRVESTKSTHGECRTPGIPTHKFSTNDGWHVTRDECAQALESYRRALLVRLHPTEFRDDFIPFLIVATTRDGFEVW